MVHFFNGGATLQFAAIPLNLCGGNRSKEANYQAVTGPKSPSTKRE